jgi:hypothetical protein
MEPGQPGSAEVARVALNDPQPEPSTLPVLPPASALNGNSPSRRPAANGAAKRGTAAAAKTGIGLCLRTADGDESITPFRSLEDLLSAVKPVLRTAARSAEPIWFSLQSVDLATLNDDIS